MAFRWVTEGGVGDDCAEGEVGEYAVTVRNVPESLDMSEKHMRPLTLEYLTGV